jgi:hypothetical protein
MAESTPGTGPERRLYLRVPCPQPLGAVIANPNLGTDTRPARIANVSRGGLALLLEEPLPVGTALAVEVDGWDASGPLLARVVHATELIAGWLHGCQLADPLTAAEFMQLLDRILPADAMEGPPGP